jgi:Zn-dependent protease
MIQIILNIIILAPPIMIAIILHEVAHGWVANRLGDPTARNAGRLTLNPIPHIDLFGTVLLSSSAMPSRCRSILLISGTRERAWPFLLSPVPA